MFPSSSIREAEFVTVHTTAAMETTKPPRKRRLSPANVHLCRASSVRSMWCGEVPEDTERERERGSEREDAEKQWTASRTGLLIQLRGGNPGILNPKRFRPLTVVDRLVIVLLKQQWVQHTTARACQRIGGGAVRSSPKARRERRVDNRKRTSFQLTSVMWSLL